MVEVLRFLFSDFKIYFGFSLWLLWFGVVIMLASQVLISGFVSIVTLLKNK